MGNTIRCCIACILPCGALDVVRIVHSNGRVEEISGSVRAIDVIKAHPKHVLKKPTSHPTGAPRIVVVPPDADLKRGKIYFLIPVSSAPPASRVKRKRDPRRQFSSATSFSASAPKPAGSDSEDDRYLTELLSEKVSTERDRRRGRVTVWRPHLESIIETASSSSSSPAR